MFWFQPPLETEQCVEAVVGEGEHVSQQSAWVQRHDHSGKNGEWQCLWSGLSQMEYAEFQNLRRLKTI